LALCTGPDGRMYCVPQSFAPYVIVYWAQHFPEGFPRNADTFLQQAEALKQNALPAVALAEKRGDFAWMLLSAYGGSLDDGAGRMMLNTPQIVQAVELLRTLTKNGYAASADAFATGRSAALAARFDRLTRLQRLISPSGITYSGDALGAALAANEAKLAPIFGPSGKETPVGCFTDVTVLAIPKGARNEPGARALIQWLMSDDHAGAWTARLGGVPVRKLAGWSAPAALAAQMTASTRACKPWQGSLRDVAGARALILDTLTALTSGAESANPDIAGVLTRAQDEYNAKNGPQ
jgi:spermidine/putrescine-binding protein